MHNTLVLLKTGTEAGSSTDTAIDPDKRFDTAAQGYIGKALLQVPHIARSYLSNGIGLDDLIAAGNLGLVEAAMRFDPSRNVKFMTYADSWIRKMMRQALDEQAGPVRLPRYQLDRLRQVQAARRRLIAGSGKEPSREQLASDTGLPRCDVEQLLQLVRGSVSLEQPVAPGDSRPIKELLLDAATECPHCSVIRRDLTSYLLRHLTTLDAREHEVIKLRYGLAGKAALSLREAGRRLGISRECVRQLELRALSRLKQHLIRTPRSNGKGDAPGSAPRQRRSWVSPHRQASQVLS